MSSATNPVAVIGVGRMGGHHARILSTLAGARLVAVVDPDAARADAMAQKYNCQACASIDQLLTLTPKVKAAVVATPTAFHHATASALIDRGVHCLVEKPLAATPQLARQLAEGAAARNIILQVGHTERFNPAVQAVLTMTLPPRFIDVHRVSPMTFRSLDVGVVLDMMIHDLDIVLTLAKSPLTRLDATGVAVIGPHEDVAQARLEFESGCVANLTASRLALRTERRLRLFSEEGFVSLDYQNRDGVIIRRSDNQQALDEVRQALSQGQPLSGMDYSSMVKVDRLNLAPDAVKQDALTAELTSFLQAVAQGTPPVVDAWAGLAAVETAHKIVETLKSHRWEKSIRPVIP
ncbi:MAG: Gfo/Idh/MocA family oxidoreductase [Phycisphaeraceae bacterium]|nr:Gfo/Idh/MocA family oxidoreductase [Phycisphaeraceae bacterium]